MRCLHHDIDDSWASACCYFETDDVEDDSWRLVMSCGCAIRSPRAEVLFFGNLGAQGGDRTSHNRDNQIIT